MTLEKHVIDTVKEWQTKIGTDDAGVRLYYPKVSMCGYLKLPVEEDSRRSVRRQRHISRKVYQNLDT